MFLPAGCGRHVQQPHEGLLRHLDVGDKIALALPITDGCAARPLHMSKATQRRERKLANDLRQLAISNPERFKIEWETMLRYWTLEAIRRGKMLQQEPTPEQTESQQLPVFGVLKKAERLLALCGPEAENLVGPRTRELLNHDCGKSFALAVDPNMYHLSVKLHKPKSRDKKAARTNPSTSTKGD